MCEYCVFPARYPWDPPDQETYDCLNVCHQGLSCSFMCPVAVNKTGRTPYGPPYEWGCPTSPDELYPTCIVDKFPYLLSECPITIICGYLWLSLIPCFRKICSQRVELQPSNCDQKCLSIKYLWQVKQFRDTSWYIKEMYFFVTHRHDHVAPSFAFDGFISDMWGFLFFTNYEYRPWLEVGNVHF